MTWTSVDELATELGLDVVNRWTCHGLLYDVTTEVRGGGNQLRVRCPLATPIPYPTNVQPRRGRQGGWSLGLGLSKQLLIHTDEPGDLGTLLADQQVYPRLVDLTASCRDFVLTPRLLEARITRRRALFKVADDVRRVAYLISVLQQRMLWQWQSLAQEWGLDCIAGQAFFEGHLHGVRVRAQYLADPPRTTTTAWLTTPLPANTHIGHPGVHRDVHEVGDPILDPMLAFHSSDPDALAMRVRDDSVRGPLLAMIREYPGSIVLEREVHLVVSGLATDGLRSQIELAVEVARALG